MVGQRTGHVLAIARVLPIEFTRLELLRERDGDGIRLVARGRLLLALLEEEDGHVERLRQLLG